MKLFPIFPQFCTSAHRRGKCSEDLLFHYFPVLDPAGDSSNPDYYFCKKKSLNICFCKSIINGWFWFMPDLRSVSLAFYSIKKMFSASFFLTFYVAHPASSRSEICSYPEWEARNQPEQVAWQRYLLTLWGKNNFLLVPQRGNDCFHYDYTHKVFRTYMNI